MNIIAAFRWEPSGDKGYITYMLLNRESLGAICEPKQFPVKKNDFTKIEEILKKNFLVDCKKNLKNSHATIKLEYKTIIRRSPYEHRNDSEHVHKKLNELIKQKEFNTSARLQSDLSGNNLEIFKTKLRRLGLIDSAKNKAWIHHLWAVALHVTPSTLDRKLKK